MKKSLLFLATFFALGIKAQVQTPLVFNYQAIARDAKTYEPYRSQNLSAQVAILDKTATPVYEEMHINRLTSVLGVFTLEIGNGSPTNGTNLGDIDWADGPFSLSVEINVGDGYHPLGEKTPLVYVPYALYARTSGSPATIPDGSITGEQLNPMGAQAGQFLQWNGSTWAPVTATGGDNWGTATVQHDNTLGGDGTSGSPLSLAPNSVDASHIKDGSITATDLNQMGASANQVLEWDGTKWAPANVGGVGNDNWGSQSVVSDASLSGDGTVVNALKIAQQGATTGQVLQWNGTKWTPATVTSGGDDWGSQSVVSDVSLTGIGTAASVLKIAQQGATAGQVLKWNGAAWIPQDDQLGSGPNYTGGTGINVNGTTITNTGDADGTDDITISSQAGGDVTGTFSNLQIGSGAVGANEIADGSITSSDLAAGVLPTTLPPSGPAGGDLSGTYPNPSVASIQGHPVSNTTPQQGQVMVYDNGAWKPVTLSFVPDIAIFEEAYGQNTCPNYADPNSNTFQTRRLNTTQKSSSTGNILLVNPNTSDAGVQLTEGTYLIQASASIVAGGAHKLFLRNTTGQILLTGTNELANNTETQTSSSLLGVITVDPSGTTVKLDHWFNSSPSSCIFGTTTNIAGAQEVYARIMIQKIQ